MNFDHVNKISDFTRNRIMPHLSNRMRVTDFGNYLTQMYDAQSCKWLRHELRVYPVIYLVDPVAFVKKYSKKCVTFTGSNSPQDGVMNIIYQISPTFHVMARLYHWVEYDVVRAYFMLTCAYRNQEDYLQFFDENIPLRLTGNTEERKAGFGADAAPQDTTDLGDILRDVPFGMPNPPKDETP